MCVCVCVCVCVCMCVCVCRVWKQNMEYFLKFFFFQV